MTIKLNLSSGKEIELTAEEFDEIVNVFVSKSTNYSLSVPVWEPSYPRVTLNGPFSWCESRMS